MYAIVEITKGIQFKVSPQTHYFVPKLDHAAGEEVVFEQVLLLEDEDKKVSLGTPFLDNCRVKAKIIETVKDKKKIVFKKKRRKGYQVKNTHRQPYTKIFIETIIQN